MRGCSVQENHNLSIPPTTESKCVLPHDAIRDQLTRILASDEFQATFRGRDFLRFIVEETLSGRSDLLKGYTIATAVFDRDDDFDSTRNPIVRIQAGRLRRALERYYLAAGGHDPIVIDIPKGRYIPRFTARTLGDRLAGRAPLSEAALDLTGEPAVAVLPFENLTGDPEKHYFALGLAEDLVSELSRYQDLTVIPCHRAMAAGSLPPNLERYCRSLGARFMLTGSIRCDKETVKFAIQLIDAATGRQVWAHSFKRSLEAAALIQTQEEIAQNVISTIASEFGIISRRLAAASRQKSPAELSTYEAMLRYYTYMIAPSPAASARCFTTLRAAADQEPDYGPVWSALANLYCQMFVFDTPGLEDPLAMGLAHAQRGTALEPGRQGSRLILAYAYLLGDDLEFFHEEAETALSLNSTNPYATGTIGYMTILAGDFEWGRQLLDQAMERNPFHPQWFRHGVYLDCFRRGDYESALEAVRSHDETGFWHPAIVIAALGKLGRAEEAAPLVASLLAEKPDFSGRAKELMGRSVKSGWLLDELRDGWRRAGVMEMGG